MTKLKNPLLSLGAVGRLGKAITFRTSGRQIIAETIASPRDVRSAPQLAWRHMYQKAVDLWHALSPEEKQEWETLARRKHMTGFAWFMSQCLRPNPGIYLPLQGGTMQGNIDMATHRITALPVPTADQEAATKKYVDDIEVGGYTEGARVYHNVNQAIPHITSTKLAFNSERYDTDAIHDPVTNNSRLTCKTAGKYIISFTGYFAMNLTGDRDYWVLLNNTTKIAQNLTAKTVSGWCIISLATIWDMAVNDYVELVVSQRSGDALDMVSDAARSPEFSMQRIG